jgi:hypothetical protein
MRVVSDLVRLGVSLGAVLLLAFAVPRRAAAEWPPCGRAIATAPAAQEHSAAATDGAGGAIITWHDERFPSVNIFAQHVLASGVLDAAWPLDGQALLTDSLALRSADGGQVSPVIVPDGEGGAIVAWEDNRSPVTETDVFAQHILASGAVDRAWPADGAPLSVATGLQNTLAIAADGTGGRGVAGGAFVVWMDTRPGTSVVDIFAQHVLGTGQVDPRWPANGLAVCAAPGRQEFPVVVEDGSGGVIVAWDDLRSSTTGDDIFSQHVLASGAVDPAWPVNGRALCTAPGDQGRPTIASDGAQGAIVAWTDGRTANSFHIFAEHVLATGVVDPAWPTNGRGISAAGVIESRPLAVSDGQGGAIVNWQGFTVHLNMFAQHIQASGVVDPAWPAGGRALSHRDRVQDLAEIVPDGSGGAVVAWNDSNDVVAQHVLATGVLDAAYPDGGRRLCDLDDQRGDVALVATGAGGAIAAWTDTRNGKDTDIYAVQILEAEPLDVPGVGGPKAVFLASSPNPARGSLMLRFALPQEGEARLSIYDLSGRRVRELISGARPAGEQSIAWDLRDANGIAVRPGLYFARLEAAGRSLTQRLATR